MRWLELLCRLYKAYIPLVFSPDLSIDSKCSVFKFWKLKVKPVLAVFMQDKKRPVEYSTGLMYTSLGIFIPYKGAVTYLSNCRLIRLRGFYVCICKRWIPAW
jgi:hypothetical protein